MLCGGEDFGGLGVGKGVLNDDLLVLVENEGAVVGNEKVGVIGKVCLMAFEAGEAAAAGDDE